jgi:hypothetical protein
MASRSTHVVLENQAGSFNLRRTKAELDHGIWKDEPPLLIGNKAEWESESDGFLTGTEGRVTYALEDVDGNGLGELALHWDNPFVGSNSYDESVSPKAQDATDSGFSIAHVGGGGDNATVRFVLFSGFCQADGDGFVCSLASPVQGTRQSPRYAGIWEQRPGPSWHARHGLSSAQYQAAFDDLVSRGFRLVDVSGYGIDGQDFYAAIWEQNDGRSWAARHGLTSDQYQKAFDEHVRKGFRLVDVSGYEVGGEARYAAIFQQNDGRSWSARHGLTAAQYQQTFDEHVRQGFRLVDVSGYGIGGQDFYAAIFEQNDGRSWAARHGLTSQQYQQAFDDFVRQGFRPVRVSGYSVGGQDRYAAIFERTSGPAWAARHALTSDQYQQAFNELLTEGFRLVQVNGYPE